MSEQPFMQLYVSDVAGDTLHLSAEQFGAYMLLLMAMWNHGGELADDEKMLSRIARVTLSRWRKIGGPVMAFMTIEDGKITQKRLKKEYTKAIEKRRKKVEAGKQGGRPKSLKNNNPPKANGSGLLKQYARVPEPEPDKSPNGDNPIVPCRDESESPQPTEQSDRRKPPVRLNDYPSKFQTWRRLHPKRLGGGKLPRAFELWKRIVADGHEGLLNAATVEYRRQKAGTEDRFIKAPDAWLNDCWQGYLPENQLGTVEEERENGHGRHRTSGNAWVTTGADMLEIERDPDQSGPAEDWGSGPVVDVVPRRESHG